MRKAIPCAGCRGYNSGMDITYFGTPEEFRAWLEEHHASADSLQVGLKKKGAAVEGITYEEALNEALCFGWIDGVTRSIDEQRWTVRFSPRRSSSKWSRSNVERVQALTAQGRMRPAGLAAFEGHEQRLNTLYETVLDLDAEAQARFQAESPEGWDFYQRQPASYRRIAARWVTDAKREETRSKRLAELIALSGQGKRKEFM